ncbi:hypothetical protein P8452_13421 [Trifolium repens]|nr:hypothetical protein P8452_13421 [Trifolium repens]
MATPITSDGEKNESNLLRETSIESLPEPVLHDIITIVGSNSVADLHSFKMSSKFHSGIANDRYVLNKVSLDRSPNIQFPWEPNENALAFLKRCEESGNPEALWSEGLREFFNYPMGNWMGREKLRIAAEGGYNLAKYAYGLIMLCSENDESRIEGIKHLRYLRMNHCILHCRRRMTEIQHYFWRNNGMLVRNQTLVCKSTPGCGGWRLKRGRWGFMDDEDDDTTTCENCRWDHELQFFYGIFRIPFIG